MAKKMIEKIRDTEIKGEKIVSEAIENAKKIIDDSIIKVNTVSQNQKKEVIIMADNLIENAKSNSDKEKEIAMNSAKASFDVMLRHAENNKNSAINKVIELLAE